MARTFTIVLLVLGHLPRQVMREKPEEDEDQAEDGTWDLPSREVGDIITVKVACPVDQDKDVWAQIVDDFRDVVITAPQQCLPKLRPGQEM